MQLTAQPDTMQNSGVPDADLLLHLQRAVQSQCKRKHYLLVEIGHSKLQEDIRYPSRSAAYTLNSCCTWKWGVRLIIKRPRLTLHILIVTS